MTLARTVGLRLMSIVPIMAASSWLVNNLFGPALAKDNGLWRSYEFLQGLPRINHLLLSKRCFVSERITWSSRRDICEVGVAYL